MTQMKLINTDSKFSALRLPLPLPGGAKSFVIKKSAKGVGLCFYRTRMTQMKLINTDYFMLQKLQPSRVFYSLPGGEKSFVIKNERGWVYVFDPGTTDQRGWLRQLFNDPCKSFLPVSSVFNSTFAYC